MLHLRCDDERVSTESVSQTDSSALRAPLAARVVTFLAVVVPIVGLAAAIVLLWGTHFHWVHLAILGGMYLLTVLGIGVGYHRLFTHRAFETSAPMRFIWGVLGSMSIEGPLFTWVGVHRKHHQHTDEPGDPHSPHAHAEGDEHGHGDGIGGVLRGLWHAHIGWFFEGDPPDLARYVQDLERDRVAVFINRTFVLWAVVGMVIPAVVGGLVMGSWMGVLLGFLWGGLVRVLLVHHVTWSINSVCHLWGSRPFKTRDESRDNVVFGLLAFGEGWHNTHHAFPTSARHGLEWWKFDLNYWVIRVMAMLGLARNVRVPSRERILARKRGARDRQGGEGDGGDRAG